MTRQCRGGRSSPRQQGEQQPLREFEPGCHRSHVEALRSGRPYQMLFHLKDSEMTPEPKHSKLALALKARFATPESALRALGLDPVLLAQDKNVARDDGDYEAAEEAHSDKLVRILKFLDGKLSADDYNKVAGMVDDNPTGNVDPQSEREDAEREAKDSRGTARLPRPGGKFASDRLGSRFEDRWPEVSRITIMP
jgi:hypothetical protein